MVPNSHISSLLARHPKLALLLLCVFTGIMIMLRIRQFTFLESHSDVLTAIVLSDKKDEDLNNSQPSNRRELVINRTLSSPISSWRKGIITELESNTSFRRFCNKSNLSEIDVANLSSLRETWKSERPWESYANRLRNASCDLIREEFMNNFYVSEMERNFPIAYILVVHTSPGQIMRMLKAIYRPHNLYCISPDAKQGESFARYFAAIAECLDNVFMVSKPVSVYYGHISVLDAQLHCMQDLEKYPESRWKYVINLCGREIPLKTNRQIVESLMKMKGYTVLNLRNVSESIWYTRFRFKYRVINGSLNQTKEPQGKPPIKIYKSLTYLASSRPFMNFVLHDPVSLKLYKYLETVLSAEEHYYASLYVLPRAQGARAPNGLINWSDIPFIIRSIWVMTWWKQETQKKACPGLNVIHYVCILSGQELRLLEEECASLNQHVFFFNKYYLDWDPTPMDCMEERLVQTNMREYELDCSSKNGKR